MRNPSDRRRDAAIAGHTGDTAAARAALSDEDPTVRAVAIGALARAGALTAAELAEALSDPDAAVRRRACELAAACDVDAGLLLIARLHDADAGVAEVAAWALGELAVRPTATVAELAAIATAHDDALVREAAVASLGAIGDPAGLPAILAATNDKPAVRRRAVLALAPFDGPDVVAALERAALDRDWQVRDAAELLRRAERGG